MYMGVLGKNWEFVNWSVQVGGPAFFAVLSTEWAWVILWWARPLTLLLSLDVPQQLRVFARDIGCHVSWATIWYLDSALHLLPFRKCLSTNWRNFLPTFAETALFQGKITHTCCDFPGRWEGKNKVPEKWFSDFLWMEIHFNTVMQGFYHRSNRFNRSLTYLEAVLCVFAKPIFTFVVWLSCSGRIICSLFLEKPCRRKKIKKLGKQIIKAIWTALHAF